MLNQKYQPKIKAVFKISELFLLNMQDSNSVEKEWEVAVCVKQNASSRGTTETRVNKLQNSSSNLLH